MEKIIDDVLKQYYNESPVEVETNYDEDDSPTEEDARKAGFASKVFCMSEFFEYLNEYLINNDEFRKAVIERLEYNYGYTTEK